MNEVLQRAAEVARLLPAGSRVSDATVVGLTPTTDGCLIAFRQAASPWAYAIALDLRNPRHEYLYGPTHPVSSWSEWIESFPINLLADLDTGLVVNARRTQGDGHVLLHHDAPRWPTSAGVDFEVWASAGSDQRPFPSVEVGDLRTPVPDGNLVLVLHGRGAGTRPGAETLAVVTRTDSDAVLVRVAATPGTPRRQELDTLHAAVHLAELSGAVTVTCDRATYGAEILGFVPARSAELLEARTSFLAEDFEAALDA